METIIIAVFSITIIGAVCAAILTIASKVMAVSVDERVAKIQEALPGTNCGACGYPGCSGYASALVNGGVKSNLCTPGGAAVIEQVSAILGVEGEGVVIKAAYVHCGGYTNVRRRKMDYRGIETCYAASHVFCGESACAYGCLGYGDCLKVCPEDAICLKSGSAHINTNLCTGCGLCVKICPRKIISVETGKICTLIACCNIEKGAAAKKRCDKCCIGCGKCVRECPEKAMTMTDNLARIDYEKCTDCGHCAKICVTKCIQTF